MRTLTVLIEGPPPMLRITKLTDYAIVLLTKIACEGSEAVHNARDLAVATGLPQPMVGKILKSLTRSGVLLSFRGSKGGYGLSRPPEQINMAEIVGALEGPIAITECLDHAIPTLYSPEPAPSNCGLETLCPVRGNWSRINDAIRDALMRITLAEMAQPIDFRRWRAAHQPDPAEHPVG